MNPGFSIFGLHIAWYGVIIAVGMIIAIFIAIKNAKQRGLKKDDILNIALIVIPLSIIGARLYYVLFFDHTYTFWEIFQIWNGGMAIYGGIIGGAIGILIYCLVKKKNFLDFADIIVPALILAQGIGRWGNFVNQEAYGYAVENSAMQWFPFAVFIQSDGLWHLATFFYESLWNLVGFELLMLILYKFKNRGVPTASYLIFYGMGRFWIEGLRTDSLFLFGTGIRVSQALSLLLVIGGVIWLTVLVIKKYKKSPKKEVLKS